MGKTMTKQELIDMLADYPMDATIVVLPNRPRMVELDPDNNAIAWHIDHVNHGWRASKVASIELSNPHFD